MAPKTILVAISADIIGDELVPSAADVRALAHAQALAARLGAAVRLVHCIDFFDERFAPGRRVHEHIHEALKPRLDALCRSAADVGVEASYAIRTGTAHREVLAEAVEIDADVIVASPRRQNISFGDRLRHGSTSRRLVRRAP